MKRREFFGKALGLGVLAVMPMAFLKSKKSAEYTLKSTPPKPITSDELHEMMNGLPEPKKFHGMSEGDIYCDAVVSPDGTVIFLEPGSRVAKMFHSKRDYNRKIVEFSGMRIMHISES